MHFPVSGSSGASPPPTNERVISLTERVLLNRWVLDWIYPSNCRMQKVQNVGDSVIQSFIQMQANLYANPKNTSYRHWVFKPVRSVLRAATVLGTTVILSPLGAIYYGTKTIMLVAAKAINRLPITPSFLKAYDSEWGKIAAYAKAFFTDLTSFIVVVVGGGICLCGRMFVANAITGKYYPLGDRIIQMVTGTLLLLGSVSLLGMFSYDEIIPQLLAWEEERGGMYMSLRLRNDLGLGDEKGGLLPFSSKDALWNTRPWTYAPLENDISEQNRNGLNKTLRTEELKLFILLGKANSYFQSQGQPQIMIVHLLSKKEKENVIKRLENSLPGENFPDPIELRSLIEQLRFNLQKFEFIKSMFSKAVELSRNASLFVQAFGISRRENSFNPSPCSFANLQKAFNMGVQIFSMPDGPEKVDLQNAIQDMQRIY